MSSGHEEPPPPPAPAPARSSPALVATVFALLLGGAAFTAIRAVLPGGDAPARHGHGGDSAGAPLPVYAEVPPFSFTERSGRTVTRDGLRGKIWVADFIFTNCAGVCLEMSTRMAAVHEAFRGDPDALCVSVSVDPDRDTPEALREYAAKYGASEDRWLYLRGPVKAVLALSYEGFRIGDAEDPLIHSARFVLVDRQGRIRGYYRGTEAEEVARLLTDYRALRAEAP